MFVLVNVIANASAQESVVYIDPVSYTAPDVGVAFTINVSIANATNLYAYHLILWYNTTLLDGLEVELPPNHFLTPSLNPNNIFTTDEIDDNYNATHGVVGVMTTLTGSELPKNGSGILATISFNATNPDGPSPLRLYFPGFTYPVKLSDPDATPIACTAVDGTVEVIPEFPSFLLMPLIIAMTLVVIVLRMSYDKRDK
jgi:hypothetical protein